MNQELIKSLVKTEINNWKEKPRGWNINRSFSLTKKVEDFIVELIQNIQDEPSPLWKSRTEIFDDFEDFQREAIRLVPEALESIIRQRRSGRSNYDIESKITVWEVYESLSRILISFCFIPQKKM